MLKSKKSGECRRCKEWLRLIPTITFWDNHALIWEPLCEKDHKALNVLDMLVDTEGWNLFRDRWIYGKVFPGMKEFESAIKQYGPPPGWECGAWGWAPAKCEPPGYWSEYIQAPEIKPIILPNEYPDLKKDLRYFTKKLIEGMQIPADYLWPKVNYVKSTSYPSFRTCDPLPLICNACGAPATTFIISFWDGIDLLWDSACQPCATTTTRSVLDYKNDPRTWNAFVDWWMARYKSPPVQRFLADAKKYRLEAPGHSYDLSTGTGWLDYQNGPRVWPYYSLETPHKTLLEDIKVVMDVWAPKPKHTIWAPELY